MASVLSGVLLSHGFRREPSAVKSKIADLQKSFGVCSDWLHQTGAGIEEDLAAKLKADNDKPAFMLGISDLEMTKLSKCRYYAELECILGSRATSMPIVHVSTIDNYNIMDQSDKSNNEQLSPPATPTHDTNSTMQDTYDAGTPPAPIRAVAHKTTDLDTSNAPPPEKPRRKSLGESSASKKIKIDLGGAKSNVADSVKAGMEFQATKQYDIATKMMEMQQTQFNLERADRLRSTKHKEAMDYANMMRSMGFSKAEVMEKVDAMLKGL
ncbi:hypothetical protein AeMF1_001295 [Aphanomyces euteiches]|nr:hypothetical protein AeMF1_008201 [Aphanomyces euteiches]KAH9120817.1 hypothetical protein AeMF1_007175 [Aphanomyces euteiches]KAH9124180.1 hypothetical protein AeMF1_005012 [Aphanomyces euteiches]KAH9128586.1 hypothetical protein AeMF1_001295 [Aphanomyces euteiches]